MENGMTLSDIAAVTKDNDWGGGSWIWVIVLFLFMFGNNGWNRNNAADLLTADDMQRAIDLNSIQNGQRDIEARVQEVKSAIWV